ncbi:MAG TPA: N-acetylmuramoyl-L-alanine amidase [Candidatus Paceibacterota bacterium]|nr:N-acetylmuramoyl-L-alanine amidase [Candidatus Paceibacterota bacterium]
MRIALLVVFVALLAAVAGSALAAFPETTSPEDLRAKYQNGTVRILIMPGHEPTYGGAEQNGLRERDIAVQISNKLAELLRTNPRYEVTVARDTASWHPDLDTYFEEEWKDIQTFVKTKKRAMERMVRRGDVEDRSFEVAHNTAATDVAYRLYGINKWANEEGYDLAIHVHLNDNVGAEFQSGFAVYVPDQQYGNARASRAVGEAIAFELNDFNATSTLPIENHGIVEDQDLIALGAFNTADFASLLVEYGYIYESKIAHPEARSVVFDDMAYQTYRGLQDFFGDPVSGDNTLALPFAWTVDSLVVGSSSPQAYALQAALHRLGFYPPQGQLLIGCPISGYVGECTIQALKAFQAAKGLEQTGSIGPRTKAALQAAGF